MKLTGKSCGGSGADAADLGDFRRPCTGKTTTVAKLLAALIQMADANAAVSVWLHQRVKLPRA